MNFFVFYYMIYLVLNNEEKGYIMKRKIPKITNSEKQILEVLWDEEMCIRDRPQPMWTEK